MNYAHPSQIMDEIARLTPTFAGVSYEKLDELGSVQWPCNEKAPEGTPIMHIDGFVRGKGKFVITEYVRDRRAHRAALPAAAHHRPHPEPIQCRRADAAHRERRLARGGPARDPSARRRAARHPRRRLGQAREPRRRDHAARADHRARGARRGLHHVPSSRTRRPTSSPPTIRTGRRTAPNTRSPRCRSRRSNGPTEWQEEYDELAPQQPPHRGAVEAAE